MLKLRAKTLMLAKGIAKPHGFLTRTGVNTSTATKILRNDYKNIKLQHLELLCWFVGCTPNELFEWEPDKNIKLQQRSSRCWSLIFL